MRKLELKAAAICVARGHAERLHDHRGHSDPTQTLYVFTADFVTVCTACMTPWGVSVITAARYLSLSLCCSLMSPRRSLTRCSSGRSRPTSFCVAFKSRASPSIWPSLSSVHFCNCNTFVRQAHNTRSLHWSVSEGHSLEAEFQP